MVTKMEKPHYNKTYNCICQTSAIAIVFRNMSQEKKYIVEQIGFGALTHVPEMNVSHILLRKLIDCFDDDKGCLKTLQGNIKITPRKVAAELGINNDSNTLSTSCLFSVHYYTFMAYFLLLKYYRDHDKVDYTKLNQEDKECARYEH
ncbi:hypothetical protein AHAS_Ahas04G0153400 [Arachis hypogaea]